MENKILSQDDVNAKVEYLFAHRFNRTLHAYIDIAGDLVAGTLLSQIMYWFSDDKNGNQKVSIFRDGHYWIAKRREDWMKEIRISKKQYDCAIKKLTAEIEPTEEEKKKPRNKGKRREKVFDKDKALVEVKTYHFRGVPTTHIRPITENINREIAKWKQGVEKEILSRNNNACSLNSPNGNLVNSPNGNMEINQRGNSYNIYNGIDNKTEITNRDYDSETTPTDTFPNKFEKDSMYTSFSEKKEAPVKKKSRYISENYTEDELREHIRPVIKENFERIEEENEIRHDQFRMDMFEDIVVEFYRQYEQNMGVRHRIVPDKTLIAIMERYITLDEPARGIDDIEDYKKIIEYYFRTDFNRRGNYDGEITLCLSHFMSNGIINLLLNREGILWERCDDDDDYDY